METDIEVERDSGYAAKVGDRLRAIRRQKRLSLQEVEAASEQEFKASVLGAYERGERAISVPRLQRLARFYNVPVDQLLPRDDEPGIRGPTADDRSSTSPSVCVGPAVTTVRSRSTSPARGARRAGGRDAHPLPAHDPGAAAGLQRSDADHPPRRPAGHRLHPRLPPRRCPPGSTAWGSAWSAEPGRRPTPAERAPAGDSPFGVYLHVPFCAARCDYCAFATWTDRHHLQRATSRRAAATSNAPSRPAMPPVTSVFVGGGTPSLVPADRPGGGARRGAARRRRRGHRRVQPRHGDARAGRGLRPGRREPPLPRRAVDGRPRAARARPHPRSRQRPSGGGPGAGRAGSRRSTSTSSTAARARRSTTGGAPSRARSSSSRPTSAPTP